MFWSNVDLIHGRTAVDLWFFRPRLVCMITVSPVRDKTICGPYYFWDFARYTSTSASAGNLRNSFDYSTTFEPFVCLSPNSSRLCACYFDIGFIAYKICSALCCCCGRGLDLIGLGIAPKTRSVGNRPSGTSVQFTKYYAMDKDSAAVVSRSRSVLIF